VAISDDVLKRQRAATGYKPERKERPETAEKPSEPPKPKQPRVPRERKPRLSTKGTHLMLSPDQMRLRYARTLCGLTIGPRRYGTLEKSEVTCEACKQKLAA
jgi:hypothetical protein